MKRLVTASLFFCVLLSAPLVALAQSDAEAKPQGLSLITATPDEGFELAIVLARRAVTTTQTNREILFEGRAEYADDADALIAASQVVAINFQTIAAANNYWRD